MAPYAIRRLLGGSLLRRRLLGRCLLGRSLLRRCLLGRSLLRSRRRLLGRSLLRSLVVFLAGAFFGRRRLLRGSLLRRRLLRPAPSSPAPSSPAPSWRRLLGGLLRRRLLGGRGLLRRSLRRGRRLLRGSSRPLVGARQRGQLLRPRDDVPQVGAGGELRNRLPLRPHLLAGLGVAHGTGLADGLLERTEPGDGDLLALGDLAGDRVEHDVQRLCRLSRRPRNARESASIN